MKYDYLYLSFFISSSFLLGMDDLTSATNSYAEFDKQCDRLERAINTQSHSAIRILPESTKKQINLDLARLNPMRVFREWRKCYVELEPHLSMRNGNVIELLKRMEQNVDKVLSKSSNSLCSMERSRLESLKNLCVVEKNTSYLFVSLFLLNDSYKNAVKIGSELKKLTGITDLSSLERIVLDEGARNKMKSLAAIDKKYQEQRLCFESIFKQYYPRINIFALDIFNNTLVHYMIHHKLLSYIQQCVDLGADLNARNEDQKTPLHLSIETKYVDTMRYLFLHSDSDVNAQDKRGMTPLIRAAESGNSVAVKVLLSCKNIKLDVQDNDGLNAQDRAQTSERHNSLIGELLYKKVPMTKKGICLLGNLSSGTLKGPSKSVLTVSLDNISSMIDISSLSMQPSLPARVSTKLPFAKKTPLPLPKSKKCNSQNELEKLLNKNDFKKLQKLLKDNYGSYSLDVPYKEWASFLWYAVNKKNELLVSRFLQYGANPNKLNALGVPPLMAALCDNKIKIMEELLAYGADVNICCNVSHPKLKNNMPIIYFAVCNGSKKVIKRLCQAGAEINTVHDPIVGTPLHLAITAQNHGAVYALLRSGARTDIQNQSGDIPLHYVIADEDEHQAIHCTNPLRFELFKYGNCSDILIKNNEEESSFDVAYRRKHYAFIMDWLMIALEKGASLSPSIKKKLDENGINPQDFVALATVNKFIFDYQSGDHIGFVVHLDDLENLKRRQSAPTQ